MPTYRHPKTGRTQEVQDREVVRIRTLQRIGWKRVEEPTPAVTETPEPEGEEELEEGKVKGKGKRR